MELDNEVVNFFYLYRLLFIIYNYMIVSMYDARFKLDLNQN